MGRHDGTAKIGLFTETMRLPGIIELSGIVEEFFGGLWQFAGLLTRFTAVSFMVIMLGAINQHASAKRILHELIWQTTG